MTDIPRLMIGTSRAAYIGPAFDLSPHVNVACTIVVALEHPLAYRTWHKKTGWKDWLHSFTALIPGETLHHIQCKGRMLFLYLDPRGDDVSALHPELLQGFRAALMRRPDSQWALEQMCELLRLKQRSEKGIMGIQRALQILDGSPADVKNIQQAAALACLSASRFRALFNQHTGLTFRRYRLWRRMALVARAVQQGKSLTEAAHEAGFSDSAHFSASFRIMFGISPSQLFGRDLMIQNSTQLHSCLKTQ